MSAAASTATSRTLAAYPLLPAEGDSRRSLSLLHPASSVWTCDIGWSANDFMTAILSDTDGMLNSCLMLSSLTRSDLQKLNLHSQQPRRTFTLKVFHYTVFRKFEACGFSPNFEKGIWDACFPLVYPLMKPMNSVRLFQFTVTRLRGLRRESDVSKFPDVVDIKRLSNRTPAVSQEKIHGPYLRLFLFGARNQLAAPTTIM